PLLQQAGLGQQFAQQALGQFGTGQGAPQISQNLNNVQGVGTDAGLGAYYANAGRIANEQINQQMAARGMFGSSAATDQISEAMTNLAAQRARDEATYRLQALQGNTNLAQAQDTASLQRNQAGLSWLSGLGNIAQMGGTEALARTGLGGQLA